MQEEENRAEKEGREVEDKFEGFVNCVEILLDNGADVNCRNMSEDGPLHCAIRTGNVLVVENLLQHGADFKAKDKRGFAALHISTLNGKKEISDLLKKHGASIEDHIHTEELPVDAGKKKTKKEEQYDDQKPTVKLHSSKKSTSPLPIPSSATTRIEILSCRKTTCYYKKTFSHKETQTKASAHSFGS